MEPIIASVERAHVTIAAFAFLHALNKPTSAHAVENCVPFISANPSLAPNSIGFNPLDKNASFVETLLPLRNTSPSPMSVAAICAKGAKSPDAPTEP